MLRAFRYLTGVFVLLTTSLSFSAVDSKIWKTVDIGEHLSMYRDKKISEKTLTMLKASSPKPEPVLSEKDLPAKVAEITKLRAGTNDFLGQENWKIASQSLASIPTGQHFFIHGSYDDEGVKYNFHELFVMEGTKGRQIQIVEPATSKALSPDQAKIALAEIAKP
ncbi:MAG: hypothetical protein V4692_13030 [Bdellovibrionota bacterium]